MTDPFRHLPGLRSKIKPFAQSNWRGFTTQMVQDRLAEAGLPPLPAYDEAEREALRAEALEDHEGDLWVFAYGSLIWDPALDFSQVRMAFAPEHARRFILVDVWGGRGTEGAPGLMAALDEGDGCDGLVFRIPAERVDAETEILFRREMIGPGYHARFIRVEIDGVEEIALTFLADHDSDLIDAEITRADQIQYAATGAGFLGSSLDYLQSTVDHLAEFGIVDDDASALLAQTKAYLELG